MARKVLITSNFADSASLRLTWNRFFPADGDITLVDSAGGDADAILVINAVHTNDVAHINFEARPELKHTTIVAHMEPHMRTKYAHLWTGPECKAVLTASDPDRVRDFLAVWTHDRALNLCEWQIGLSYDDLASTSAATDTENRKNAVCAILSSKYDDPGQVMRIDLAKRIGADCYGRNNAHSMPNYKGAVSENHKDAVLLRYKYTLNMENHAISNYVTEKFWDAALCGTHLFYWGAPNILAIVPAQFHACFTVLPLEEACPDYDHAARLIYKRMCDNVYSESERLFPAFRAWILSNVSLYAQLTLALTRHPHANEHVQPA
jgi:hypothetical protein